MLRKIRIVISSLMLALLTFYFLDFAGFLPDYFHVLAHIQLVPALLAGAFGILTALLLLTLLFGRAYCSFICPMGVFQDVIARIAGRLDKKKRYGYRPARTILRWTIVGGVALAFFLGLTILLSLLDPYSAYGRMLTQVFKPLYVSGNNLLALLFTKMGVYHFYYIEVAVRSMFAFCIGLLTLGGVGFLAYRYGRSYCNTICPVGTVLGFLSKYALFKIRIDTEQCNQCGLCALKCKSSCINSREHQIDYSRCVDCFDCIGNCRQKALSFSVAARKTGIQKAEKTDQGKRQFMATVIATVGLVPEVLAQNGMSLVTKNKPYKRQVPLAPPGAKSIAHLSSRCMACHLCVSKCPSHVLKPAFTDYGLGGMMQPMMDFEKGFCNFDCTVCSSVCPNGAILPLTVEEKHVTQVGQVVFLIENCIVNTEETSCGACSEHCPTQAVMMVPYKNGLTIPQVNPDLCVGCGGCEYVCPVRPFRAIHIEGNAVHREALPFQESEKKEVELDGFGF